jgi:hypothetical protein
MPAVTGKTPGNGSATLSWQVPGAGLDVETVYASIDATAAGSDVTAELTITDPSGVVIARKTQGQAVSAGGTGSATWALRLDDESTSVTPSGSTLTQLLTFATPSCPSANSRTAQFTVSSGSSLFDVSGGNTNAPKCLVSGVFIVTVNAFGSVGAGWTAGSTYTVTLTLNGIEFVQRVCAGPNGVISVASLDSIGAPWRFAVNDTFAWDVGNGDPTHAHTWSGDCIIQQIA